MTYRNRLAWTALVTVALLLCGCSSSSDGNVLGGPDSGTLSVQLSAQSAPGITGGSVTFDSVQAVTAAGDVEEVRLAMGSPVALDQLIRGDALVLAAGLLPAGEYVRIDLTLSSLSLVLEDGTLVEVLRAPVVLRLKVIFPVVEGQETPIPIRMPLSEIRLVGGDWVFDPGSVTAG